jgi:uncharacterized phage protein gp47/JayE
VQCFAQIIGAIPAAPNTITGIVTPVYGWFSVNNPLSATIGQETESDAQLRLRIFSSSSANSYATVAAITSKLLGTTGVTYVDVLENTTLVQENTTITYSSDFFAGNTISISINGSIAATVLYDTSQAVTMGLIISQLVLVPTVATATYTGNVITITWTAVGTSLVTSASVVGGTSAPSVTWYDGVAPLAIRCVVVGTNNQAIGQAIYDVRAAGVQTTGNTTVQVPSPKGTLVNISFQIPQPIYIWVTCEVTAGTNFAGIVAVQAAFVTYGQSLGVGESVFSYIVSSIPASVTGVANAVTLISFTQSPTDTPVFISQDIAISPSQISDWDPSRISVTLA